MPALGYETFLAHDDQVAYMPVDGKPGTYVFLYPSLEASTYSRDGVGLQHLAFNMRTRASVDAVHELVVGLGSEVVEPPREFPQYPPPYYATFWLDPHGFPLEAVCLRDR
jgi:hypothetical protein